MRARQFLVESSSLLQALDNCPGTGPASEDLPPGTEVLGIGSGSGGSMPPCLHGSWTAGIFTTGNNFMLWPVGCFGGLVCTGSVGLP